MNSLLDTPFRVDPTRHNVRVRSNQMCCNLRKLYYFTRYILYAIDIMFIIIHLIILCCVFFI